MRVTRGNWKLIIGEGNILEETKEIHEFYSFLFLELRKGKDTVVFLKVFVFNENRFR